MRLDAPDETDEEPPFRRRNVAARLVLIALLAPALGYVGYLVIVLGPDLANLEWADLLQGYHRTLMPAEMQGAPLRTAQGGADRVYVLTTQAERIAPIRIGRVSRMKARQMLHVDLWAFDPATAQPAWRRRIHTFEHDRGPLRFELLGADAATLWLFMRKPLAVSLHDGALLADNARLDALNPTLVDKHVDQPGYVAFGGQGLQLTLSDSTQWVIDGTTFTAQPRAAAPVRGDGLVPPAYDAPYASYFQIRGVPIGSRWLGVLTDAEAAVLQAPAVVPGAKPGERRGVAADFFERGHIPGDLSAQPLPYRVWSAKLAKVSAAPPEWPKDWPDKWGTRDEYSNYQALPEAPPFLQAGLLTDGRSKQAFWYRDPDSVLVLHHDKVGDAGRILVARVSGPGGRVVWDAPLTLADLDATMHGTTHVAFVGTTPNPAYDPDSETSREDHQRLIALDVASGGVASYDLTSESVATADQLFASSGEGPATRDVGTREDVGSPSAP